jgi:DNA-binding beta-propeller fold protein YncE
MRRDHVASATVALLGFLALTQRGHAASLAAPQRPDVRLYVADRYEGVLRLDPYSLAVLDTIHTGRRPHGLIVSPDRRWIYITVETTNELLKVDVRSDSIVARARVGPVPNEPTISANGRYVFVPQRAGTETDVVDTETMTVVKSLPVGREEHNAYTSADGREVFVTAMGDSLIAVIDPEQLVIKRKIKIPGIPRVVALKQDGSGAFLTLSSLHGFAELDLRTDATRRVIELPVPPGTPRPLLDTFTHGIILSPDEREVWIASYATDRVYAFTVPEMEPLADLVTGEGAHWFTLHPSGEPLYVSLERAGAVAAIHRGLRVVQATAKVGQAPTRILAFRVGS